MRSLAVAALAILAVGMAACGEDEPDYNFVLRGFHEAEGPAIAAALDHFKGICPGLFEGWNDVKEAVVKRGDPALNNTGDAYGWTKEVWIEATILRNPKRLRQAEGHTLYYVIGTGKRPGLLIKKDESASVCGIAPAGGGNDTFVPDDDFSVLADLKS